MCRAIAVFLLALVGIVYPYNRGSLYTALVVIYALTSGIAGYTAASYYKMLDGANWVSISYLQSTKIYYMECTEVTLQTELNVSTYTFPDSEVVR
jgi:hypothetical protein